MRTFTIQSNNVQHWSTTIHQNILVSFVIVIISLALVFIYIQAYYSQKREKGKEKKQRLAFWLRTWIHPIPRGRPHFFQLIKSCSAVGVACGPPDTPPQWSPGQWVLLNPSVLRYIPRSRLIFRIKGEALTTVI